jgi:hypothetical protein
MMRKWVLHIPGTIQGRDPDRHFQKIYLHRSIDFLICRFLLVVLGTYKQMRNQHLPIMSDVDEDNFDRAFDLIRPGEPRLPILIDRLEANLGDVLSYSRNR